MENNNTKILIQDLHKSFNTFKILEGVNLEVKKNESLVILGSSGSGKSVLIKTIIGLFKPDRGEIYLDGENIVNLPLQKRFKLLSKCGFLFQSGALFDSLTILENVTFFAKRLYNLNSTQVKELAIKKLESVGLSEKILNLYSSELSGGMQKRVSLARAIAINPEIIFFDEPTTGLDPIMANVINELIIKIHKDLGITTITITHDINSAYYIANSIALLHEGKIVWHDSKENLYTTDNFYVKKFVAPCKSF